MHCQSLPSAHKLAEYYCHLFMTLGWLLTCSLEGGCFFNRTENYWSLTGSPQPFTILQWCIVIINVKDVVTSTIVVRHIHHLGELCKRFCEIWIQWGTLLPWCLSRSMTHPVTVWIIIRLQFIFKLTNKLTLFRRIHKSMIFKQHGRWQCIVFQKSFGVKTSFLSDFDWSLSHVHFSDPILCCFLRLVLDWCHMFVLWIGSFSFKVLLITLYCLMFQCCT